MLMTEYNESETMELFKEEGRQEGREEGKKEGRKEGRISAFVSMTKEGLLSVAQAANYANISEAEFRKYLS